MHHEPEPAILVSLDFNKVISAAGRCELDRAFRPADGLRAGMAERLARQVGGLRNDRPPIAPESRHSAADIGQDLAGDPGNAQSCSLDVQAHSQHATSNVASNRLRIDQMGRGDNNAANSDTVEGPLEFESRSAL